MLLSPAAGAPEQNPSGCPKDGFGEAQEDVRVRSA